MPPPRLFSRRAERRHETDAGDGHTGRHRCASTVRANVADCFQPGWQSSSCSSARTLRRSRSLFSTPGQMAGLETAATRARSRGRRRDAIRCDRAARYQRGWRCSRGSRRRHRADYKRASIASARTARPRAHARQELVPIAAGPRSRSCRPAAACARRCPQPPPGRRGRPAPRRRNSLRQPVVRGPWSRF